MAKTRITTIRAKNQITGQIKWFTEATWKRLRTMLREHNGKTYSHQGWVRIAEKRAPAPGAAIEAQQTKAALSDAEKQAAREEEIKRAANVAAEKQAAAKAAALAAAKEANAAKTSSSKPASKKPK